MFGLRNAFHHKNPVSMPDRRNFWAWLNIMFNRVDKDRLKEVGPDRACAEWLLRNGAQVTMAGAEPTRDYHAVARIPPGVPTRLTHIDASDASITYHGFGHFQNCKHVMSIKLHNNPYVNDDALEQLRSVSQSLKALHVSHCDEVTDEGVISLTQLSKLSELTLFALNVKDWSACEVALRNAIPGCHLQLNEPPDQAK